MIVYLVMCQIGEGEAKDDFTPMDLFYTEEEAQEACDKRNAFAKDHLHLYEVEYMHYYTQPITLKGKKPHD